ncbi:hypothetical protein D3C78_1297820 [compost metagenome]
MQPMLAAIRLHRGIACNRQRNVCCSCSSGALRCRAGRSRRALSTACRLAPQASRADRAMRVVWSSLVAVCRRYKRSEAK